MKRRCLVCNKKMKQGYVVEGVETYCSLECLKKAYTDKEIEDMDLGGDESDNYWTEW